MCIYTLDTDTEDWKEIHQNSNETDTDVLSKLHPKWRSWESNLGRLALACVLASSVLYTAGFTCVMSFCSARLGIRNPAPSTRTSSPHCRVELQRNITLGPMSSLLDNRVRLQQA